MILNRAYNLHLQSGLGLQAETLALLNAWKEGMSEKELYEKALNEGVLSQKSARRLKNMIKDGFARRYLIENGRPASHIKNLQPFWSNSDIDQLMFLYSFRAHPIVVDFLREVYWPKVIRGEDRLSNEESHSFIMKCISEGRVEREWSESTIRRLAAYIVGICSDFHLLENGSRRVRKILPFSVSDRVAAYLLLDLHFRNISDKGILYHEDWSCFGLTPDATLDLIKRISYTGIVLVQAAANIVQFGWNIKREEDMIHGLTKI